MTLYFYIMIVVLLCVFNVACLVILWRNNLVYDVRTWVLRNSWSEVTSHGVRFVGYDALPPYAVMLFDLKRWRRIDWVKDLPAGWAKR
jgi:hypothetical protein